MYDSWKIPCAYCLILVATSVAGRAQPTCPPSTPTPTTQGVIEGPAFAGSGDFTTGQHSAVAVDDSTPPRFMLVWETDVETINSELGYARLYASRFELDGTCIEDSGGDGPRHVSGFYDDGINGILRNSHHSFPSIGISGGDARIRIGWISEVFSEFAESAIYQEGQLLISDFEFDDLASTWPVASPSPNNLLDSPPSVGAADENADVRGVVWSRTDSSVNPRGLVHSATEPCDDG